MTSLDEQRDGLPAEGLPPDSFVFLSQLLGVAVTGPKGERLGKLVDALVETVEASYPPVRSLRVRIPSGELRRVEWADVATCGTSAVQLQRGAEALTALQQSAEEFPLAQDVLDRQIVDTHGAKVERVNDLHLLYTRSELRVAHVDVGLRGLVRRLGWQPGVDGALRAIKPSASYLRDDKFVPWKHVQRIGSGLAHVRLDVARISLADLHPADLVEILQDLDAPGRAALFRHLPTEAAADTLEEADSELQRVLLNAVESDRAADLVEEMEPDEAADLLGDLPDEEANVLLAAMDATEAREVQQLLVHPRDTAGGLMTTDFLRLKPEDTVASALASISEQARHVRHVPDAFVLDERGLFLGVVPLRELLKAEPADALTLLVEKHPAALAPGESARRVAKEAAKYNVLSVPVVDDGGKLLGVITIDDVLEAVLRD